MALDMQDVEAMREEAEALRRGIAGESDLTEVAEGVIESLLYYAAQLVTEWEV